MSYIKGNFKKYIFKSDNSYVVGLFKVKEGDDNTSSYINKIVTFTGYFADLNESDTYLFNGDFTFHSRYGEQFVVSSYEVVLPTDNEKIIEFLSSDLFPKIGIKKASKIVDVLGIDALNMIINDKDCLLKVPTINEKQRDIIFDNLQKYRYSYEIVVSLTKIGFNPRDALLIYNYYKDNTMNLIESDPYIIASDIHEINFKKIDKLRSNLSIDEYDLGRLRAAIKYVFDEVCFSSGNTYLSLSEIVFYTKKLLFLNNEGSIYNAINDLVLDGVIIKEEDMYFSSKMYDAEHYICDRLCHLNNMSFSKKAKNNDIISLEKYFGINYNDEQKKAINAAISNNILVITGGPGTGKTTIIRAICKLYQDMNLFNEMELNKCLALLAPTGRASKRISYQTNLPAYTIHRFLKWQKESDTFVINEENKSFVKFVIVDEVSMLDTYLFYNLLLGLNPNTKLILIGDYNQLPSVGAGQVLKDIIDSDVLPVVNLKQLYRQDEDSNINLLAHAINNGLDPSELFNNGDDLVFVPATDSNLKEKLRDYVLEYKNMDIDKFQVMAPIYRGNNGIEDLNNYMQSILNKRGAFSNSLSIDYLTFLEKDKVLQLVNMPDDNIFNGDIGKIIKISSNPKEMIVSFDDEIVKITANNFANLKLGYAISIHKAQGSEFDVVIIPVLNSYGMMLYKKLIYTGITRAKKKLIIIGEFDAFLKAINNLREQSRKTNLKKILVSRY